QVVAHIELHAGVAKGFKATLIRRQLFFVRPVRAQQAPGHQKRCTNDGPNDDEKKYGEIFLHAHATHPVSKIKPLDCSILKGGIPANSPDKQGNLAVTEAPSEESRRALGPIACRVDPTMGGIRQRRMK